MDIREMLTSSTSAYLYIYIYINPIFSRIDALQR